MALQLRRGTNAERGAITPASEYEALKVCHKYLEIGADVIYGGNWSYKIIRALRDENIPINSHVGLVPGKATWIGGFRAIGKTADEACLLYTSPSPRDS